MKQTSAGQAPEQQGQVIRDRLMIVRRGHQQLSGEHRPGNEKGQIFSALKAELMEPQPSNSNLATDVRVRS